MARRGRHQLRVVALVLTLAVLIVLLARNWSGHFLRDLGAVVIFSAVMCFLAWAAFVTGDGN